MQYFKTSVKNSKTQVKNFDKRKFMNNVIGKKIRVVGYENKMGGLNNMGEQGGNEKNNLEKNLLNKMSFLSHISK